MDEIIDAYITFCDKYGKSFDVDIRDRDRKSLIKEYRALSYPDFKVSNNMVAEAFETVLREVPK
jgi:broad-specificity NMP kinase